MAFVHGKSAYFNLDTVGGSPTDLSAYADQIEQSFERELADTTTFGSTAHTFIPGLRNGTFSVSGPYDPTLAAHLEAIDAAHPASLTFVVGPQGSTAGQRKYTGECLMSSYSPSLPVGDKNTWSAEFQCSGAVTATTF